MQQKISMDLLICNSEPTFLTQNPVQKNQKLEKHIFPFPRLQS